MSNTSRRKSEASSKQADYTCSLHLQQKVRSLEAEVKTLKNKLDELRKAKSTVILKHEKEFVHTTSPSLSNKKSSESSISTTNGIRRTELNSELDKLRQKHHYEIAQLEMQLSNTKIDMPEQEPCEHHDVITALQNRLAESESMNTALSLQCEQYQEKLNHVYEVQSSREAEYADSTEKMKVELQIKWKKMYEDWMQTTEVKIAELQAANDMLRTMMKPHQ